MMNVKTTFLIGLLCEFFLTLWLPVGIIGFNVNTRKANVIQGPKGTHFGYTARFLPTKGSNALRMIVGAPNGTDGFEPNPGYVCLCQNVLDPNETCSQPFRADDGLTRPGATENEDFGSSVAITNSGQFMICSPNWKDPRYKKNIFYTFLPGRCTLKEDFMDNTTNRNFYPFYHQPDTLAHHKYIIPIGGMDRYYHGVASFGFSVDSDKESVFVFGAPGVLMSEGTVWITDINTNKSSTYISKVEDKLPTTAYGYMGYSIKIGRFCDGSDICFAAGAPNSLRTGTVYIYRWKNRTELDIIQTIMGSKAWSSFGYSLSVVDANSDGYDELLVGAPHFGENDQGRVLIYSRSKTSERLQEISSLDGAKEKFAQFGAAIQNIGDINLDNYNDIAVGAPGERDGAGCVYIYLGGSSGLTNTPSQIIKAEQVTKDLSKPIQGFGYAFSDYTTPENEQYPVFAATSVINDTIVIFKSRPIVDVSTNLTANPNPVDMEKTCFKNGLPVCFNISLCMKYTLRGEKSMPLVFRIGLDIDTQVPSNKKRALFRLKNGSLVESYPEDNKQINDTNNVECVNFFAVIRESFVNQDRFTPVQIVASYSLIENPDTADDPLLDEAKPKNVSMTVTFLNKCGDDNKCDVDLSVLSSVNYTPKGKWNSIVVNETKELLVKVDVKNSRETAYWTVIKVEIDSPVLYLRSDPLSCQPSTVDIAKEASNTVLKVQQKIIVLCNNYKPLEHNGSFSITVVFDTVDMEVDKKKLAIQVEAFPKNVINPDVNLTDNSATMTTEVDIVANVSIFGSSFPLEVPIYEYKLITLKDTGSNSKYRITGKEIKPLNVTQKVLIKNYGPSFLPNTNVTVHVPLFLVDKTKLADADVKISTSDGRVSQCYGIKPFPFLEQASSTPFDASYQATTDKDNFKRTTQDPIDISSTDDSEKVDTFIIVNRRKKRANDDREKQQNKTYTLDCDSNEDICQVFVCEIEAIQSGGHAEINVSLVIDKANIPLPENYNAFHFSVQAKVEQPNHPLFKEWDSERLTKTVTKFQLIQSGGKVNIWIIIGSVIAGLVLITIIVLIFWKLGFFKRDKHLQVEKWKHESKRRSRKGYSKAPTEEPGAEGKVLDVGES